MRAFHHIGIFVKDLDFGIEEMSKIVDVSSISDEILDEEIDVKIKFLKDTQNINYELVAPLSENSPVHGVLSRRKDYLNHIAYVVDFFDEEIKKLRRERLIPFGPPKKAKAFDGSRVIFFLSPLGFIIELIEGKK